MRQVIVRRLCHATAVAGMLLVIAAGAAQPSAPNASGWIADLAERVIVILREQQASANRYQRFRALIDERFDMPAIAQFVAGRYWRTASEADRQKFTDAFTDYMVDFYSARFADYGNQTLRILGERTTADGSAIVTSQIVNPSAAPGAQLDWRVAQTGRGYKITDVAIAGVSLAITKRDEFAAVIQRNGGKISALTAELDRRTGGARQSPNLN
jgi:phospholipid transport system substrate-binding protein